MTATLCCRNKQIPKSQYRNTANVYLLYNSLIYARWLSCKWGLRKPLSSTFVTRGALKQGFYLIFTFIRGLWECQYNMEPLRYGELLSAPSDQHLSNSGLKWYFLLVSIFSYFLKKKSGERYLLVLVLVFYFIDLREEGRGRETLMGE